MSRNRTTRMRLRSDTTLCQVFGGKDSLDRFGDDLCQHLLSYLTLEDRFRCECVSKQWQRVVYETQTELRLHDWDLDAITVHMNDKTFECILRKCANITHIECESMTFKDFFTDSMMDSIVKHCDHLNAFVADFRHTIQSETIDKFFGKFAKQLKTLQVIDSTKSDTIMQSLKRNVKFCTNLTRVEDHYDFGVESKKALDLLSDTSHEFAFRKVHTFKITFNKQLVNCFETFAANYGQRVQTICVVMLDSDCDEKSVDILVTGLSQMSPLIDLEFVCFDDLLNTLITSRLKPIGVNCKKLKRLALNVDMDSGDYCLLLQTINKNFKQLKRLEVMNRNKGTFLITSESLNRCNRLTHLSLSSEYHYSLADNKFFKNIDQNIPHVVYMEIMTAKITTNVLNSVSKLQNIRSVQLYGDPKYSEKAAKNLVTKCPKVSLCINGDLLL